MLRRNNNNDNKIVMLMPKKIIPEQENKIYEGYTKGLNEIETAEYAGVAQPTVSVYWKKKELSAKVHGEALKKILEAHELELSFQKAQEYTGRGEKIIRKVWREHHLLPNGRVVNNRAVNEETKYKIYEARDLGMNQSEAARYANTSRSPVQRLWKKEGLEKIVDRNR